MTKEKPVASVSLDLDNKWSFLKTHGHAEWATFPSYLDLAVPRILDFLRQENLKITFFVVGQDAALDGNAEAIRALADAGHEIANHSFSHEPWLHLYTEDEIEADLRKAHEHIERITGRSPVGFRGPGYSLSLSTLKVLKRMGYYYDCSTLPTYLGSLARMYYFMSTRLTPEERQQRSKLFGTWKEGLRPNTPYHWQLENGELLEIPVTTMPIFKVPIHVSYVLYLNMFSRFLAIAYFQSALMMCRIMGVQPSILLGPLDFMDVDDASDLAFFPAMRTNHQEKIEVVSEIMRMLGKNYRIVPMQEHAMNVNRRAEFPVIKPRFEL